jgi:hypothetical protein
MGMIIDIYWVSLFFIKGGIPDTLFLNTTYELLSAINCSGPSGRHRVELVYKAGLRNELRMRINRHHGVEYFHGFIFKMDWCREISRGMRDWSGLPYVLK